MWCSTPLAPLIRSRSGSADWLPSLLITQALHIRRRASCRQHTFSRLLYSHLVLAPVGGTSLTTSRSRQLVTISRFLWRESPSFKLVGPSLLNPLPACKVLDVHSTYRSSISSPGSIARRF